MNDALLLRDVEVPGTGITDVRIEDGLITAIGPGLAGPTTVSGNACALLPGLADHHLHLAATAALAESLDLTGVPADGLRDALATATPDESGWIRAVGYDDGRQGELDRQTLDAWTDRPVRVQHRSGALWVLNSAGLRAVGSDSPDGRLWRADHWLGDALGTPRPLSLAPLGSRLASYGITHVTDASPGDGHLDLLAEAIRSGDLPQHVLVMAAAADPIDHPRWRVGPEKIVVGDHALPDLDGFIAFIAAAHDQGRPIAVHCVTRAALALTLAALDSAGHRDGDRIEHCSVAGADLIAGIAARGLRVVTQPSLVALRGDDYVERSEPADRPDLWPYAGLLAAGIRVAPSSDAPYGDLDPWACLRAAAARTTASGRVVGEEQRVPASTALAGMLSATDDPGGIPRTVGVGAAADLVLLDRTLGEALRAPDAGCVRMTLIEGRIVFDSADSQTE